MYKAHHSRTTFGSWDVEKVHAVVARSTFWSQNAQNTPFSDHFWKLRCWKKCTPLWREAHFQVKMCKTHLSVGRLLEVEMSKKVHAVVARSTFRSQNVQNTPCSDHFWKLRCRKSACRCGAKHISKSKCTKHTMLRPLLEVEMSKKCMPLWREAHFEVKMYKNTTCSRHFWRFRCRFASLHYTTLHYTTLHYSTLHYTTLHYTTLQLQLHKLHSTTLHYTKLHYTTLQHTTLHSTTLHYITLHWATFHYTSLHYTTLHYTTTTTTTTQLHSTTIHSTTLHYTTLHYTTLQLQLHNYTPLHSTTLNYTTLHYTTLHYTTTTTTTTQLHSTTRNYTTLHYTTLHYIPLHSTTLHYITLHYNTLNDTAPQIDR